MKPVTVSILVAVYNAEQYLEQCLESLRHQTLEDIQIICVDDCSTDRSLSILHEYARRDSRIEVYQMPQNSGQAKARNEGVRHARGKYVAFLDSDDWMSSDALEKSVDVFRLRPLTDCVIMRVVVFDEKGNEHDYDKPIPLLMTGMEAFEASLDWSVHGWYVTRREFYEQWPYDETCKSYSDDNVTRQHFFHSREVRYEEDAVYHYRDYAKSVTRKASVRRFDYLRANESMKRQLEVLGVDESMVAFYENQRWLVLIDCYMFYHVHASELSADERRYGLSELKRIWQTIDRTLLNKETTAKFGYRPCKFWWMFRLQEWCYFTLRGFLGKNR